MDNKRVLITGGAGFIGNYIARNLLNKGFKVRLFDLDFTNYNLVCERIGDLPGVERVRGSILDNNALCNAVKECDYVIHAAAMLGVKKTDSKRLECLNVNILGVINILEACLKEKVKKIIFTSSSEVYGEATETPIKEETPKNPVSIYAITKLAGEEYVRAYAEKYGLDYSIVRFFNVYGPGQVAEFVMPKFIKMVLKDKSPIIYGNGSQIRSFCFIEDVAEGVSKVLTNPNSSRQVFNIGNDKEPISMQDLAEKVITLSGRNLKPEFISMENSDRHISREIQKRIPSIAKANNMLGYMPEVSLDEGIKKTLGINCIIDTWFES